MWQPGFFDIEERYGALDAIGDPLVVLKNSVSWEDVRPICAKVHEKERKSPAGRKPLDPVMMFKALVVQSLYNLSDQQMELLGYGVWIGAVVGLFPNTRGSATLALLVIAGLSALVRSRRREELSEFIRSSWQYLAFVEALFLVVLAGAVFIRSFAPEIIWGGEAF